MSRNQASPTAKAMAARHYLKQATFTDPIEPLAEAVGNAIHRLTLSYEKVGARAPASKTAHKAVKAAAATTMELASKELHGDIKRLVAQVLEDSLSEQSDHGKLLRMALMGKLAGQQLVGRPVSFLEPKMMVTDHETEDLLTTAEAAKKLNVSRPYVSMLCDAGKLGSVRTTEGGHRRIRPSAIEAYLTAQNQALGDAVSPREAGVLAGLYARGDDEYENVVRKNIGSTTASKKASSVRLGRK